MTYSVEKKINIFFLENLFSEFKNRQASFKYY